MNWSDWNLSYAGDIFGPLYGGGSVKAALTRTLDAWLPTYIAEINRQLGATVLFVPKSYFYRADERPIAPNTSQVTVSVPRTVKVERYSENIRGTWQAEVRVFYAGLQDWNESEFVGQAYGAAVRSAIIQHGGLGDVGSAPFAESTMWQSEALGADKRTSTYQRCAVLETFHVVVSNVVSPYPGPLVPLVTTPAPLPEVETISILLDGVPDTQAV